MTKAAFEAGARDVEGKARVWRNVRHAANGDDGAVDEAGRAAGAAFGNKTIFAVFATHPAAASTIFVRTCYSNRVIGSAIGTVNGTPSEVHVWKTGA